MLAMSANDFANLRTDLVKVHLIRSQELIHPDEVIEHCWFLEDGIASIVAMSRDGNETESGIVGRDGMVDVATILGVETSPTRCFIQIPGDGYRIRADRLKDCMEASPSMRSLLNRYTHNLLTQIASTAHANASFTVERRLARWLMMCSDRLGGNDISLTHDLMSTMLSVRRAGVTEAVNTLQRSGLVETKRGVITIVDRPALTRLVDDCYTPVVPY